MQHGRGSRIAQIYEGTNGIQAIDLVARKLPRQGGAVLRDYLAELRGIIAAVEGANDPAFGRTGERLAKAADSLARASDWVLAALTGAPEAATAHATAYLRLFATVAGGCMLAEEALAAARRSGDDGADMPRRIALARFFAENLAAQAPALARLVIEGADSVLAAAPAIGSP